MEFTQRVSQIETLNWPLLGSKASGSNIAINDGPTLTMIAMLHWDAQSRYTFVLHAETVSNSW